MEHPDDLRRKSLGNLAILHDHLISYITFLLDLEDAVRLSSCSRVLRVFACEEPLWLALCLKLQTGLVEYKANWRQTALASYSAKRVPAEAAARPLPPVPWLNSAFLYRRWYRCHVDLRGFLPPPEAATVQRISAAAMTPGEFAERFDAPNLPVLLGGLQDNWPAASWSLPALCAAFPSACFKVAKPHGGRAVMTLPAYVDYMARQADEEPLYIFDAAFVEAAPGIRQLYEVPHVFSQDYFGQLGAGRPHYRWLVLGPARAGASWHVDPSLTSAWNALLSGRKRWALYPPHIRPPGVALDDDGEESHPEDDNLTSLQWFLEVYPGLPPDRRPIEFVQNPGEVVFVPGGWWHCVLNLETAVAVTQNFVSDANLARVVRYMAHGSSRYMAKPLSFYDPQREVAGWAAAYPALMAAAAAAAAAGSESDAEAGEREEDEGKGGVMELDGGGLKGGGEGCRVRGLRVERLGAPEQGTARCHLGNGNGTGVLHSSSEPIAANSGAHYVRINGDAEAEGGDNSNGCGQRAQGAERSASEPPSVAWHSDLEYAEVAVWRRHRPLGRWLRALWEREPQTRPTIQDCLSKYLHAAFWRLMLRTIADQTEGAIQGTPRHEQPGTKQRLQPASSPPADPPPLDLIPLSGADALVFLYGSFAIKIFAHEVPAMRGLMCALEAYVPRLLQPAAEAVASDSSTGGSGQDGPGGGVSHLVPRLPQPVACGALAVALSRSAEPEEEEAVAAAGECTSDENGVAESEDGKGACKGSHSAVAVEAESGEEAPEQELLYLVQERMQASCDLQALVDAKLRPAHLAAVAEALGHLVGAMHAAAIAASAAAAAVTMPALLTSPAAGQEQGQGQGQGAAAAVPACGDVAAWERLVRTAAVWHDRDGHIWVSGLGRVSAPRGVPDDEELDEGNKEVENREGNGGAGGAVPVDGAVPAPGEAAPQNADTGGARWACDVPISSAWWPFVQHLRLRQRSLLRSLRDGPDGELAEWPAWVRQQLPAYLPADPAQLLGFEPRVGTAAQRVPRDEDNGDTAGRVRGNGGVGSGSGDGGAGPDVPPVLLHGDLTAQNIALVTPAPGVSVCEAGVGAAGSGATIASSSSSGDTGCRGADAGGAFGGDGEAAAPSWRPQLCVVDFADAGHGDPLHELLPVLGSCAVGDTSAMRRFWAAYRRHVDTTRAWPQRQGGSQSGAMRLSYCAMCYSLLHEEAEVVLRRASGGEGITAGGARGVADGSEDGERGWTRCDGDSREDGTDTSLGGAADAGGDRMLGALAESLWGFLDEEWAF